MGHCWEPLSPVSVFFCGRRQLSNPLGYRHPWRFPLTRHSPRQCTAERVRKQLFMVRRSFPDLFKAAFPPLYCAIVRPHLACAIEAKSPALRADINQMERAQRFVTWLMRGLSYVPYEEKLRQPFSHWHAGASELTSSWPLAFSKVKLT